MQPLHNNVAYPASTCKWMTDEPPPLTAESGCDLEEPGDSSAAVGGSLSISLGFQSGLHHLPLSVTSSLEKLFLGFLVSGGSKPSFGFTSVSLSICSVTPLPAPPSLRLGHANVPQKDTVPSCAQLLCCRLGAQILFLITNLPFELVAFTGKSLGEDIPMQAICL
ncbi:unnamed protein product [Pleuronectes platessa]|uniref:Uncharacterized protein n=1 Tax=Pleuronectes platessa TaxID=8262 RepID=A0A9N7YM81_PLEPL|nr:unnamed protein product [Pleuronectes platessa]